MMGRIWAPVLILALETPPVLFAPCEPICLMS